MSNFELSYRLFFQLAFILAVCRLVGLLAKKLLQPQVVAEMVAGVLMGPSLLGLLLSELQSQLFPKVYERVITGTPLGTLALAAGSMDDAAAWCILAVVLASLSYHRSVCRWRRVSLWARRSDRGQTAIEWAWGFSRSQ